MRKSFGFVFDYPGVERTTVPWIVTENVEFLLLIFEILCDCLGLALFVDSSECGSTYLGNSGRLTK